MSDPTPISVPDALAALGDRFPDLVGALRDARLAGETGVLSERDVELIRLGVMIAIDAPAASFDAHVRRALAGGMSRDEIIGVAASIATIVGVPRILSAMPKITDALDG